MKVQWAVWLCFVFSVTASAETFFVKPTSGLFAEILVESTDSNIHSIKVRVRSDINATGSYSLVVIQESNASSETLFSWQGQVTPEWSVLFSDERFLSNDSTIKATLSVSQDENNFSRTVTWQPQTSIAPKSLTTSQPRTGEHVIRLELP